MARELPLRPGWRTTSAPAFREARAVRNERVSRVTALILDTLQHGETQCHFGMPRLSVVGADWLANPDNEDAMTAQLVSQQLSKASVNIVVHRPAAAEDTELPGAYIWAGEAGEALPYTLQGEVILFSSFAHET